MTSIPTPEPIPAPRIVRRPDTPARPPVRPSQPPTIKFVVTALAVLVGWVAGNSAMSWFRREPAIAKDLLSRHWVTGEIGQSSVMLDTPWPLEGVSVPFPKEFSGKVQQWTWLGRDKDGLNVMTGRVVFSRTERPSLEGAAEGMVRNIQAVPGTTSVTTTRRETKLLGSPAIELELRIQRKSGEPLRMHGVVILVRQQELIQLLSIAREDQPIANEAWARMRNSLRIE